MFWEHYRKCCLQECEVLLQFAGVCCLIGNTRLGFSMCPVKWRRCSCACCPLGLASFALFTQLAIRFSFWVTASLLCGFSCAVCAAFQLTVIGMTDSNKMKIFCLNLFVVVVWVKLVINKELCSFT